MIRFISLRLLCAFSLLAVLLLSACRGETPTTVVPTTALTVPPATAPPQPTITRPTAAPTITQAPQPTLLPSRTPTTAPSPTQPSVPARPGPSAWREWPVVPSLTVRSFEIYRRGLALGNDPTHFSKVADCQGIREVLLGAYDQPGLYKLSAGNEGLQEAIDWFGGSFNRNGMAVMGGYNARAVLQPQYADQSFCLAGESPIECEYRIHRPSIALVSLEFGYEGRTAPVYEAHLRQTIEFFIARGVLPILSTKADNFEGDHSLNLATARLAAEYDLPLWNWWRAAQDLPNKGLDPTRPDGFHISVDAWRVRSSTALQALDAVWRGVRGLLNDYLSAAGKGTTPGAAPTPSAAQQTAAAGTPPKLLVNLKTHSATLALLSLSAKKAGNYEHQGVFALDPVKNSLVRILEAGWKLQDVAPDGKSFLASRGSDLYRLPLDGSAPEYLTDALVTSGRQNAMWAPDDQSILFTGAIDGVQTIYLFMPSNGTLTGLFKNTTPIEMYPSPDLEKVYFLSGVCGTPLAGIGLNCAADRTWTASYASPSPSVLPGIRRPALATDENSLAYTFLNEKDQAVLAVTTLGRSRLWSPLPEGYAVEYAWSKSARWLAALLQERSDYSGRAGSLRSFLLNPSTLQKVELAPMSGLSPRLAWSANGQYLLAAATDLVPGNPPGSDLSKGYRLSFKLYTAASGQAVEVIPAAPPGDDGKINLTGMDFIFVSHLVWLP